MKKLFITSVVSFIGINSAVAAGLAWWEQPTVCRINPAKCYTVMTAGFESGMWDPDSKCYGMKYICPDAFKTNAPSAPELISRDKISEIASSDFDTNILSKTDNCFGVRKSNKTGNQVMMGGKFTNVWCPGVLDNHPTKETENGEITDKPVTYTALKSNGYIGVENGKCWGKPYDDSKYYVDCGDNKEDFAPARLVILNGAEYDERNPATETDLQMKMKDMYTVSKEQKAKYFK